MMAVHILPGPVAAARGSKAAQRRRKSTMAVKSLTNKPPSAPQATDNNKNSTISQCLYGSAEKCGENAAYFS